MTALGRIERLPNWPARMTAPVAAAYMGISTSTFLARFKAGGVKEGANLLWAKAQLDAIIATQFGMAGATASTSGSVEQEIAAWKAGRGRK